MSVSFDPKQVREIMAVLFGAMAVGAEPPIQTQLGKDKVLLEPSEINLITAPRPEERFEVVRVRLPVREIDWMPELVKSISVVAE